MAQITTPKEAYTVDYQWAIDFAEQQADILWTDREIAVSKDIQDIKVNMTPSETHGVLTTLKLFTLYEVQAGLSYWLTRVVNDYPRPDIQRMAVTFGYTEIGSHAPFYAALNTALNQNTDEFYMSYYDEPVLKSRMKFVGEMVNHQNKLISLGAFSMIEGAVLYSSFAFLMHFQTQGKDKLNNVVRGIKFSVKDENIHSLAGARLFQQVKEETGMDLPVKELSEVASIIQHHEHEIIDMIFEKGDISGITPVQLKSFVNHRLNLCLNNLGINGPFDVPCDVVSKWFYKTIKTIQFGDLFNGTSSEYNRDYIETEFTFNEGEIV